MTTLPPGTSTLLPTAAFFTGGALVTACFSASLYLLTHGVTFSHVLLISMIVPSLTWLVHLSASWVFLPVEARLRYWRILGIACWVGSVALLPAAFVNLALAHPPGWLSTANVLLSVLVMAAVLFRLSAALGRHWLWPTTWCITIAANMALFVWISTSWWR
jgi:hypothetical protein